ncbi:hypothetical protein [Streptosporangium lutulentum]|uniref:hypothetical protein n=1 Tax=Streptosporangium lutulentum TaxID=1461250 RepID=UPI0036D78863
MRYVPNSVDGLLDDVEPLSHGERCRRLFLRGREWAGRPELRGILDGLAERGQYERFIGVILAGAAGEIPHVIRAMRDPDPDISSYAIGLAGKLDIPDEAIVQILRDGSMVARAMAYRVIRRDARSALAEQLINEVRQRWGDPEAAALLASCRSEVVASMLDDLAHAVRNWSTLAKRHPLVVLDHAEAVLSHLPRNLRDAWWATRSAGVEAAASPAPERVIALLERYWTVRFSTSCVGWLLEADPRRTLDVFLLPGRQALLGRLLGQRAVRRRLAGLPDEELGAVGRAVREDEGALVNLLRAVAPSRRVAVFDAAMAGVDLGQVELSGRLLEVLPRERRAVEARRMLGLRQVAQNPSSVLEVTGFLPYGEAEPVLRVASRRPDAGERALGYRHLIACAGRGRDPEIITSLLESLGRLRNEQDPVRLSAVEALAAIPPGLFEVVHLPALEQLADDALGARDCSYRSRSELTRLATRIFEQGALRDDADLLEYALRTFERLVGHQGTIYLGQLSRVLRRGQETVLVRRLAPYLRAEADRDRHEFAFLLAALLDHRGHELPELQEALKRALTSVREADVRRAIDHWLAPPRTRGDRVAGLLKADPSTVTLDSVFRVIAWQRTDLLDVALGRKEPRGRFTKRGVRQMRYAGRGAVRRWTARQREAYLRLVRRIADNAELPKHERAEAVRMVGEIPAVPAGELGVYLRSPDDLLRRMALTALPWTARPQEVLADLLTHAGGDDAHVAVHAAARAARFVRPAELAAAVEPILTGGKITVRKEAARLIVRHRVPDTTRLLLSLWDEEGQHPDVRAAIVSAALGLLDDQRIWRLLADAVAGARDLAVSVLGTHLLHVPPRQRQPYAGLIVDAARSADHDTRRTAVDALRMWAPFAPRAVDRLSEIVGDLGETADWTSAARGLVSNACGGVGLAELHATVLRLAAAPDEPDARADRDRPAGQRLSEIVTDLCRWHRLDRDGAAPVIHLVVDVLPTDLQAELIAATTNWEDPREALTRLVDRTAGGVLAAVEAGRVLGESTEDVDCEQILPHAVWLAGHHETGGLLAAALAAECGPRAGWSAPWRELVRHLRGGDSREVTYLALRIHTATE